MSQDQCLRVKKALEQYLLSIFTSKFFRYDQENGLNESTLITCLNGIISQKTAEKISYYFDDDGDEFVL